MTIIVQPEEFLNWVKAQPDEKELNFAQVFSTDSCGCPMVQYGREKGWKFGWVWTRIWTDGIKAVADMNQSVFRLLNIPSDYNLKDVKTYGALKKFIN